MSTFSIKECFLTLQGEGFHAGRRAVFVRFSGCNGWSGLDADRGKGPLACSAWCDTNFVGIDGPRGGRYDAVSLARTIAELWDSAARPRFVVLTGGEPMLQVDEWLVDVLHRWECEIAIETNGTKRVPEGMDWVTVSPKAPGNSMVGAGAYPPAATHPLLQAKGSELKLVYPQVGAEPERFVGMDFRHFFLQPMDGDDAEERAAHVRATVEYCLAHPQWRLSVQMHKVVGLK